MGVVSHEISYVMLAVLACVAVVIIYLGVKYKKYICAVLSALQTSLLIWFVLGRGDLIYIDNNLYADGFSWIMILASGVTGMLICVYALSFIRRPSFYLFMLISLTAMIGITVSNNLLWLYLFWEIMTLCTFFLIGFDKTPEAVKNSFCALSVNLLGGLAFVFAIVIIGSYFFTIELSATLMYRQIPQYSFNAGVPVALLAFAGLVKAAQMPFSRWLLGAASAPSPAFALLASSTTAPAGAFLIIKLSPALGLNMAGVMVMLAGGVTFLMASLAATARENEKDVLAYSAIASLGLIVACGGVGTYSAVWAGILLIIFHAITKSLLFLCVEASENKAARGYVAPFMMIGIAGMFLAPFGMLISRWAALVAFADAKNILLILLVCFGSAATIFYGTRWLGRAAADMQDKEEERPEVCRERLAPIWTLSLSIIVVCLFLPSVSSMWVVPYLEESFFGEPFIIAGTATTRILWAILAIIVMAPMLFFGKTKKRIVPVYAPAFDGRISHESPDLGRYFGEHRMNMIGGVINTIAIAAVFSVAIAVSGGVLL